MIATPEPNHHARWNWVTLWTLGAILLFRLISLYFNQTALFFDEAQYWLWGKEPDFGYFSKPPLLGWIIGSFTYLCGSDSEFCVRLPSPVLHTITSAFIFLGARRLFDARTGYFSALTFATLPGISLSSTLISTDVPLLLCWAGAFWLFLRFRDEGSYLNAIGLGIFIGAGLMAKYAMVYFVLCMLLFAMVDHTTKKRLFSFQFAVSLILALMILAPNLIWNADNAFITAQHTGDNIGWRGSLFNPDKMGEFLGSQFGVFGPILFAFYLIALIRFVREGWDENQKLLVFFSLPVLALITLQALLSKAYANWAAATYVCATILITDIMVNRIPFVWARVSLSIHAIIAIAIGIAVVFSAPGILQLPNGQDVFTRLHGWRELAQKVETKVTEDNFLAVIGGHRHLTAELVYYLRESNKPVFALAPEKGPHDHYEMTRPYIGKPKGPLLLVNRNEGLSSAVKKQFQTITPLGAVSLSSGTLGKVWLFRLEDFGGLN